MLKFMFLTPVISHWIRLQMKSPSWSEASWVLLAERFLRGTLAEPL